MAIVGSSQRDEESPVLITEAEPSYDDQQAQRRRKYAIMMSLRIPCLVIAVLCYQFSWWLALIILAVSIPLPWMAVLIANDRPPKKRETVNRYRHANDARSIEAREHRIIDGS